MNKGLRFQKIVDLSELEPKKIEILANSDSIVELIHILTLDEGEKIEKLIKFDLKQIEIIKQNLNKIIKKGLNFTINLYPYTLIYRENLIKKELSKIKEIAEKTGLSFGIEIVENSGISKGNYDYFIRKILDRFNGFKFILDDIIISFSNENNTHSLQEVVKILGLDYKKIKNISAIKFDLSVLRLESEDKIVEGLLKLPEEILCNIDLVFEGIENEKELEKIEKLIKSYNKKLIENNKHNFCLSKKNVFLQGYFFHVPEKL